MSDYLFLVYSFAFLFSCFFLFLLFFLSFFLKKKGIGLSGIRSSEGKGGWIGRWIHGCASGKRSGIFVYVFNLVEYIEMILASCCIA